MAGEERKQGGGYLINNSAQRRKGAEKGKIKSDDINGFISSASLR
jgi:hypothetical protein